MILSFFHASNYAIHVSDKVLLYYFTDVLSKPDSIPIKVSLNYIIVSSYSLYVSHLPQFAC